ncbi:hypothetical protein K6V33_02720 [Streptococcus suis]|nr:hypothetical protein [Streptococcus suis]
MRLSEILFYLFLLAKPFYFFKSGGVQPGDVFLALSAVAYIVENRLQLYYKSIDKAYLFFYFFVVVINLIYFSIYYGDTPVLSFILPILYYLYNLLVIILCRYFFKKKEGLLRLRTVVRLSLYIQLILYFVAPSFLVDTSEVRYTGTFNDPNQLGFFLLSSIYVIVVINRKLKQRERLIDHICAMILLFATSSTGILLGFASLYFFYLLFFEDMTSLLNKVLLFIFGGLVAVLLLQIVGTTFISGFEDSFLYKRLMTKIDKGLTNSSNNSGSYGELTLIQERGIDRVLLYPQYILFGAGEGYYKRFVLSAIQLEIHSTFLGMLFYYGIIPFSSLLYWIWGNIRKSGQLIWIVFLPLIIESFTLANQRQPYFWILFVLASTSFANVKKKDGELI